MLVRESSIDYDLLIRNYFLKWLPLAPFVSKEFLCKAECLGKIFLDKSVCFEDILCKVASFNEECFL